MLHTMAVDDLGGRLEFRAPRAVEPLVFRFEEVGGSARADALEQSRDAAGVTRLGGANPVVLTALELAPVRGERGGHAVDPCLRRHPGAGRRLDHGLAVLVHPHDEMDGVTTQAVIPGDAVGTGLLQAPAPMRPSLCEVRYRGCI